MLNLADKIQNIAFRWNAGQKGALPGRKDSPAGKAKKKFCLFGEKEGKNRSCLVKEFTKNLSFLEKIRKGHCTFGNFKV